MPVLFKRGQLANRETEVQNCAALGGMNARIERRGVTLGEGETPGSSVPAPPTKPRGDDLRNVHVDEFQPNTAL
jgi:hypothetical protein